MQQVEPNSQVNDIKLCVHSQPYLILWVVLLTLAWQREKSLNRKGLYLVVTKKAKKKKATPPFPTAFMLLITAPLDQVS